MTHLIPGLPSHLQKPRLPAIGSALQFQLLGTSRGKYIEGPVLWSGLHEAAPNKSTSPYTHTRPLVPTAIVLPTRQTRHFLLPPEDRSRFRASFTEVCFHVQCLSNRWSHDSPRWKGAPWTASTLYINTTDEHQTTWRDEMFAAEVYNIVPGVDELRRVLRAMADEDPPSMT